MLVRKWVKCFCKEKEGERAKRDVLSDQRRAVQISSTKPKQTKATVCAMILLCSSCVSRLARYLIFCCFCGSPALKAALDVVGPDCRRDQASSWFWSWDNHHMSIGLLHGQVRYNSFKKNKYYLDTFFIFWCTIYCCIQSNVYVSLGNETWASYRPLVRAGQASSHEQQTKSTRRK
jgi:hypothetical protein